MKWRANIRAAVAALILCILSPPRVSAQVTTDVLPPSGSGSIAAANSAVRMDLASHRPPTEDYATAAVQVSGTWSGTLVVECSVDSTTYTSLRMTPTDTTTVVTSTTANGLWTSPAAGCKLLRVRASAWSSGTAVVTVRASSAVAKFIGGQGVTDSGQNGSATSTSSVSRTSLELNTQTTAGTDESLTNAYTAFKFTATAAEMGGFRVRLKRDSGLTAGTVSSFLYNDSAGSPGTNISDGSTGLPALLSAAGLGTTYAEYEFRLPQTGMTVGNAYWLILNVAGTAGGNVILDRQTAGTNLFSTSANGSSWSTVSNKSAWVKVLGNAGRSYDGSTDTGSAYYATCASGFCFRGVNTGTGLGAKFDGTFQEGMGCTSLFGIGCRASSTFNHAFQSVAGPSGLSGAQIITQAAGQPGAQIVSTSGPAVQLVPATGAFAQILPLDASAGGVVSTWGWIAEEITLSGAATTDSTTNLLPANTVIDAVCYRVTQAISGGSATAFQVGTAADAIEFANTVSALTLGTSGVGLNHWLSGGHAQAVSTATKVRITLNGTSTAGKIRIVVFYRAFTAPAS